MWPSLITRYVIVELLKVCLTALAVFTLVLVLVAVAQEAIREGLSPLPIVRLIPYALPNALVFALPATILFGTCSVFGRMSASNELVALKSLGFSPTVFTRPALMLAFALSLVTVWLIDVAFSWGYQGMRRVVLESAEEIVYGVLRTQHSYSTPQFSVDVAGVYGHRLIHPTITLHPANRETINITAREARLSVVPDAGAMKVSITDGMVEVGENNSLRFPDTIEQTIPLVASLGDRDVASSPSHMRLFQLPAATLQQRSRIAQLTQSLAAQAAFQLSCGGFDSLVAGPWSEHFSDLDSEHQRLHRLDAESYRRWASGFSCLAFVVVGLPLAVRMRNSDVMTTFGICFLPILIVYYPLFATGLDHAKNGLWPPYCVWAGNLVCLASGGWLLRKVVRY